MPRLQWAMLLILTAFVATGSLFSTGCSLVNTGNDTGTGNNNQNTNNNNNNNNNNANANNNANSNGNNNNNSTPTPTPTPTPTNAFTGPQQSSTIAISSDSRALVAVNPETNTVTVFDATGSVPVKTREVTVASNPRSVTVMPNGTKAYIACAGGASATTPGVVGVLTVASGAVTNITVGIEPMAIVLSPNATRVYVANSVSNTISVIDTALDTVIATVAMPVAGSTQPRALAISNNNDATDTDETLYIANFFAARRPNKTGLDEGQDDQRQGHVFAFNCLTNAINPTPIALEPTLTGFASNGSTLDTVATEDGINGAAAVDPVNPAVNSAFQTTCYPNQLASIALYPFRTSNPRAYVAGTAASPNGPVRFNVNVHGLVSVVNLDTNLEDRVGQVGSNTTTVQLAPLNLNRGVQNMIAGPARLFNSNPTAIVWNPVGTEAWVAIQTADTVVRMTVDANGVPTINAPLAAASGTVSPTAIDLQANALPGRAPFGLVFRRDSARLYVNNFVSRSITAIDTASTTPQIVGSVQSAALPDPFTVEDTVQQGARFFFSGRENGALSSEGWGACIACHPDGRADGVTWMFGPGPRQTISLDGQFSKRPGTPQRLLNFSAIVDESQDFENNSRGVSGGRGFIADDRQIILVGGFDDTSATIGSAAEILAPPAVVTPRQVASTNNSITGGPLPVFANREAFGHATARDGTFYIGGGADFNLGSTLNDIIEYYPTSNTSRTRASLRDPKYALVAAAVQTAVGPRVYFIGGYDSTNNVTSTVEEYNPSTNTVRFVAPLPLPVAEAGCCTVTANNTATAQDVVWVVGGNDAAAITTSVTNTAFVFTPPQDGVGMGTWSRRANAILHARSRPSVASIIRVATNSVFTIGGFDNSRNTTTTVEEFTATGTVNTLVVSPLEQLPDARARAATSVSQGQIYLLGGLDSSSNATSTVLQFNPTVNGSPTGVLGRPSGSWTHVLNLPVPSADGGASIPLPVNSFVPVANSGRDDRQDAINEWIKVKVRSHVAANRGATGLTAASIARGRTLFTTTALTGVSGVSCATCHGGDGWTRSRKDYVGAPSVSLASGAQEIVGVEMRRTASQPGGTPQNGVLVNVGTFVAPVINPATNAVTGGTANEVRTSPADVGQRISALGGNGFNIPSLLSVGSTAPYYHSGRAQTLDDLLTGVGSGQGASPLKDVHTVIDSTDRADLVEFLKSIDDTTTPVP